MAGVPYELRKGDKVVDQGKLTTKFRVVSIFWPPAALIYWPVGFCLPSYDLTNPDPDQGVRSSKKMDKSADSDGDDSEGEAPMHNS